MEDRHKTHDERIKSMATDALTMTGAFIDKIGPRLAGSNPSRQTADELCDEFSKVCDKAVTEDFTLSPKAFLGFIRVMVACYGLSCICMWANLFIFSFVFSTISMLTLFLEYILYWHLTDCFYTKTIGRNVYGVIEPEGEVKQIFVWSGHHDSAAIFNFYEDYPGIYMVREICAMVLNILMFLVTLSIAVFRLKSGLFFQIGLPPQTLLAVAIVMSLLYILVIPMWGFLNEEGCPGAGDNLASSMMGVQLAHYFAEQKKKGLSLKHTKLIFASFDAEESGLRGSRAFWQRHKKEFNEVPTYNINSDCPFYHDELRFLTKDINQTVILSEKLALQCCQIAKENGFDAKPEPMRLLAGGTDSGEAARAGVNSTCLLSIPFSNKTRPTVYHTREDTVDKVEPKAVEQGLKVAICFAEGLDIGKYN